MESLIHKAFLHVDVIGRQVHEGRYDLINQDGEIILPQVWESMAKPDWSITMAMWPIKESKKPMPAPPAPPGAGGTPMAGIGSELAAMLSGPKPNDKKSNSALGALPPGMPPPLPPGVLPPGVPPPPPPPGLGSSLLSSLSYVQGADRRHGKYRGEKDTLNVKNIIESKSPRKRTEIVEEEFPRTVESETDSAEVSSLTSISIIDEGQKHKRTGSKMIQGLGKLRSHLSWPRKR
jgi:hypothetical protein